MIKETLGFKRRLLRILWGGRWVLLGLVILLAIIRLILPFAVARYVNRQLNRSKDYGGRLKSVHMQLYKGQYRINDVAIFKRDKGVHVPLFSTDKMYLSIEWKELFHGAVVGKVLMVRPRLNFVSGPTEAETQTGTNEDWGSMLKSLFPFDLNRFEITNGQIHFQNEHSAPPVDIYLNGLAVVATNLSNSRNVKDPLPGGIKAGATTIGGGGLDLNVQLDPLAPAPTYQLTAQLTNVDLTALNSFLKAYGKFDVERGEFALYASVASKDGTYDGYLKVFFEHLNVFAWEKEKHENALQVFWDAIVGTVTTVLKNHRTDSLATRIPVSGSYKGSKVGTWTAVATLLRHGFIRALVPSVDEKVTVQGVEKKEEEKKVEKERIDATPPSEKAAQRISPPAN